MNAEAAAVTLLGLGYLVVLFAVATAVERHWVPAGWSRSPLVGILALGVYANAWALAGSIGVAWQWGYGYLAYSLGAAGSFLLAPVLLVPLQRLARTHQLSSLADLFAFRFRSRWVGTSVTLLSLTAAMPLVAMQAQAMGQAIQHVTAAAPAWLLSLCFCAIITLFAILFGARHTHAHRRYDGLTAAMAVESLIKLAAFLALGAYALYAIFSGPGELEQWLSGPAADLQQAHQLDAAQWRTLLLLFFGSALLMPHMFHISFARPLSRRTLLAAGWGVPLLLLLLALPVPLILWGAQRLGVADSAQTATYAIFALSTSPSVLAIAFIALLAATCGTLILTALALAGMMLNHLALIAHPPVEQPDLYRRLRWLRRALIATVILAGWGFSQAVDASTELTRLGLVSVIGMAQCLPGLLALLYWPGANRKGVMTGLGLGTLVWCLGLWLPLITPLPPLLAPLDLLLSLLGSDSLAPLPDWYQVSLTSLGLNALSLILVSLASSTSPQERAAAEACSVDAVIRHKRLPLSIADGDDAKKRLASALGEDVAEREVNQALASLRLSANDARPYALRRLRERIQANLSGLMGPSIAQDIVDHYLPYRHDGPPAREDIHFVEHRLEAYRSRLTGMARELDELRRHHRHMLARLPVGLCAFGDDDEILMWNDALSELTGIAGEEVIGAHRAALPTPWNTLLGDVLAGQRERVYHHAMTLPQGERYISLLRARLDTEAPADSAGGTVILVEDHSEMKWLENELIHAARLASIGQMSAGVAHEIGNPITGISSLAQNLRYDTSDPHVLETAQQIQVLTERVSRIVGSLVGFAHGGRHVGGNAFTTVSARELADQALHLLRLSRPDATLAHANRCAPHVEVYGDQQRLLQVLVNLLTNACDACPTTDSIFIDAGQGEEGPWLSVTDAGPGIDPKIRERLFEPFATTKPPGQGTGLGLALVVSIVAEHDGKVEVISPLPGQARGTRIQVWLCSPVVHRSAQDAAPHEPNPDR
ncbi:MAG: ATP-binding protein [Pseudomonadota bacterium]|nr:ATP-binding protein [Pseudomonadota bacterium]